MAGSSRWYFDKKTLADSPSKKCGIEADDELSYRQQAANLIQDMGQRLRVTQLCINTAIVYMHRFYVFHSITKFRKSQIAACALFLAAKVEEQPRKLECVVRTAQQCLHQQITDPKLKEKFYQEQANLLVKNENIMLQTLGFDIAIEHPHTFVVKCCQLVRASKDLAQTCYFMATNSLHLTTMCLQYKPTIVACVCIHLASKWSNWEIPKSSEGKDWFYYVDPEVSFEKIEELTTEFLAILQKCPSRLKRKMTLGAVSDHNLSPNYDSVAGPSNSSSYSLKVESRSSSASKSDLFSSSNVKSERCTQVPSSSSTTALNHTASSSTASSSRISPAPSSSTVPHKSGDKYTHSYSVYKEKKEQERREEQERKELERREKERKEQERRENEQREFERLEREKLEREEQERKEQERKEQERKEQERKDQERREWERKEAERLRLEAERRELERREAERREAERREAERREAERREFERREAERREAERREAERQRAELEARELNERRELERQELERQETERRLAIAEARKEAEYKAELKRKIEMDEARKRAELERKENERRERESEMMKKEKDRREKHSHHKNKSKNHPPHSHQQPQSTLPVHPDHNTDSTSYDHNNAASDSNGGDVKPPIKIKLKLGNNQKSEPEPAGLKIVIPKSKLAHDPSSQSFNASSGSRKRKNSYESGPGSIGKKQNCT